MVNADDAIWIASVIALSAGMTFLILYFFRRWSRPPPPSLP
jgi:hypothetical protein